CCPGFAWSGHSLPGASVRANLGRLFSRPGQPLHPQLLPRLRSVSASPALGFSLDALPASPEHVLHARLLFLEYRHLWLSSVQCSLACRQRIIAFRAAAAPVAGAYRSGFVDPPKFRKQFLEVLQPDRVLPRSYLGSASRP